MPGLDPRGGSTWGSPAPNAIIPTLPARRTPRRPNTSAAPSATSAFSRSAVPNAIDADTSSTIQVVSARSGTCRRTWGMPGAGRGGGVEMAHVVAELVGPQLGQLGAQADPGGPAIAGQRPRHQPGHGDVQRLDQGRGNRARALARGRRCEQRLGHALLLSQSAWVVSSSASGRIRRSALGSGTVASTRSSSSSTVTPSLSAS